MEFKLMQLLVTLAKRFQVPLPLLDLQLERQRGHVGMYYNRHSLIVLYHHSKERDTVDTLLHEFAHHLCAIRRNGTKHDDGFVRNLIEVVSFYYGSTAQYPWYTEYKSVQRRYHRHNARLARLDKLKRELKELENAHA